jgi:tripartite-type tricarboxylate transporter receptor subunit TctC
MTSMMILMAALLTALPAAAQQFPTKPLKLIVPFAPGGGADLAARIVAQKLGENLGQQIVIENQGGGGTIIGTAMAAKSAPDGYTLLVGSPTLTINPSLRTDLPFDTLKDLQPIGQMVRQPLVVVVYPGLPIKDVASLLAYAKAHPGEVSVGSPGVGSAGHLATELMNLKAGVQLLHVPYKGAGPAISDLLGGQISMMFASITAVKDHIEAGKLRAIAVSTAERSRIMPNLPTVAESGIPGYDAGGWSGILAASGTPDAVVKKLNAELVRALDDESVKNRLLKDGAEPAPGPAQAFGKFLVDDVAKWAAVIKAANIKPE